MNVLDHLKSKTVDDIKSYCKSNCIDAGVAMMHVNGDFNLSTLVRNANFFGFKEFEAHQDRGRFRILCTSQ